MSGLWEGVEIPVLGVSGENSAGKTVFISTIDPPNTVIYDLELSSASYNLGVKEIISVPEVMAKLYPGGYTPLQVWDWFYKDIERHDVSVIAADPLTDLDDGMVERVAENWQSYGFNSKHNFTSTGGIFWNQVRSYYKQAVLKITTHCKTFAYTTHMKQKWVGKQVTAIREPKGKTTLNELASLYLLLERKHDAKGALPDKPSAIVLKSRLVSFVDGELKPTLPPRLEVCTPKTIRSYILNPPDYKKLKKGELIQEEVFTKKEELEMQVKLAEDTRAAEEAKVASTSMMQEAAKRVAKQKLANTRKTASPDRTGDAVEAIAEKAKEVANEAADQAAIVAAKESVITPEPPVTVAAISPSVQGAERNEHIAKIENALVTLGATADQQKAILAKRGVNRVVDLSNDQLRELSLGLQDRVMKKALDSKN